MNLDAHLHGLSLAEKIGWSLLSVLIAIAYGLVVGGVIRKVMARIQGRVGPPVYQPYIDLFKVIFQRTQVGHGAMFYFGPVFRAAGGIGVFLLVPIITTRPELTNFSFTGDILLVIYFIFFGSLGMALGAADGGHPHSPIGITRGLAQMTTYELPFGLAIVALVAHTGHFSVAEIVRVQQEAGSVFGWNLFQHPFATAAAFLAFLGMNMYAPFNIVGAPQEIPMGPPTEMNSGFLSLLITGRSIFAVAKGVLFMDLFVGGATSVPEAFLKVFVLYFWSVFVGAVNPRFRPEQAMRFFIGWPTLLGVIAVLLALI